MKRYCIKCEPGRVEFLDVLRKTETGYVVQVIRIRDGYEKKIDEVMSEELFTMCLKTGFIYEMKENTSSVA